MMDNEAFVANDGGRWFVMRNVDHCDDEGNWGMRTDYLCDANGYDTEEAAEAALAALEQ